LLPAFKDYQKQVLANAKIMAKTFQDLGYRIVSGGTDTHLFLVDLKDKKFDGQMLTGRQAEDILMQCNIVLNRNMIPFDTQSPTVTSGIRIGTPAVTTRGMKEAEMVEIVYLIDEALKRRDDKQFLTKILNKVTSFCQLYPVY
jgi:glycine hydroxymethyltransferase